MREIVIVETRDAAEHRDAQRTLELARGLSRIGKAATILLTENGAFNARRSNVYGIGDALRDGVTVCVDSFALEERGIRNKDLKGGISLSSVDSIVDHLINGSCVIWR